MQAFPATTLALSTLASFIGPPSLQAQTLHAAHKQHLTVSPSQIKWMDAPPALPRGAKVAVLEGNPGKAGPLTLRIKFPPNYRIAPHTHPDTERITVLSGDFHIGTGTHFNKSRTTLLPAGGFTVLPKGGHHFAWTAHGAVVQTTGEGPWGIHYLNPKDDPRNKP